MQSEPAGQEGRGRALAFCLTFLPALPRSEVGQGSRGLEELQRAQSRALTVHTLSRWAGMRPPCLGQQNKCLDPWL